MSETKLEVTQEGEVVSVEPTADQTAVTATEPEHVEPVEEPQVDTETGEVPAEVPPVDSTDSPSDIDTTIPNTQSETAELGETNKEQLSQSVSVPLEEDNVGETISTKNLTDEPLTNIREEVEPPSTAEIVTKSYETLDGAPLVVITSVPNLLQDEDIPEIRPHTPQQADESADLVGSGAEFEGDDATDLLEELKLLKEEEEKLTSENSQLQHKLVEHFRSKRSDERIGTAGDGDRDRGVTDYEQRYDKYLSVLQERKNESEKIKEYSDTLLDTACDTQQQRAVELESVLREEDAYKRDSMLAAIDSRTGRHMTVELVEKILSDEAKKRSEVGNIRLENIKLTRNLNKREEQLRQKEEVAEGLHMIEFEQMKIEHQKNNEKFEDKNEDINRLRGKITQTVQVLTHVKEKLHFVSKENALQREQLAEMDVQVSVMRDRLTYMKQRRDKLRGDNLRYQEKGGLVNHKKLLRDLEDKNDLSNELETRLEQLRRRHAELGQLSAGIKQKITQAKVSGSFSVLQVPH